MSDPKAPSRGSMRLWDRLVVPILPGKYRLDVSTNVNLAPEAQISGEASPGFASSSWFDVEAPRFSLSPAEISGVFPPRNGHGPFQDAFAQVVLGRRTLPWERPVDAGKPDTPCLALLLFEGHPSDEAAEREDFTLQVKSTPLDQVLRGETLSRLQLTAAQARQQTCAYVETSATLARALMPTLGELSLLCHAREVNTEDRELAANDSDGWFAVVLSHRLPAVAGRYTACLVSVEGRLGPKGEDWVVQPEAKAASTGSKPGADKQEGSKTATSFVKSGAWFSPTAASSFPSLSVGPPPPAPIPTGRVRLVLLHHWTFETSGVGSFEALLKAVDIGWVGDPPGPGRSDADDFPLVTDAGHARIQREDRAGQQRPVWYRGPLVRLPLERASATPFHVAAQAGHVSQETGLEDITESAAFEVGRLLAAADTRLCQELLRWRRLLYREAAREDVVASAQTSLKDALHAAFPLYSDPLRRGIPLIAPIAKALLPRIGERLPKVADAFGLARYDTKDPVVAKLHPGLDAESLGRTWRELGPAHAADLLSGERAAWPSPTHEHPPPMEPTLALAQEADLMSLGDARRRLVADGVAQQKRKS